MGNKWCAPIPSRTVEDKIENHLKNGSLTYAALFRFCIVTGILINKALELKVSDLKENDEIKPFFIVENFSYNISEYKVALDEHTFVLLNQICYDKADEEYVFTAKDGISPLPRATFQKRLKQVAEQCGLSNITPKSLKKTHILHIYKTYGIKRAAYVAGFPSVGVVFEYLGLQDNENPGSSYDRKVLLADDYGKKLIDEIIEYLNKVKIKMYDVNNPDAYYLNLSNDLVKIKNLAISYSQKD